MSTNFNQISLFRSQIKNRRFNDGTLGILQSLLFTQDDVKSVLGVSSRLKEFLRSESLLVIREIAEKSMEEKLLVLEFFVCAFALAEIALGTGYKTELADKVTSRRYLLCKSREMRAGKSCLALRYEALIMRELGSSSNPWLAVSLKEWLTFAEHSLENRFYPIAKKACERALSCFEMIDKSYGEADNYAEDIQVIEKIKRLKDIAVTSATSRSVQSQVAEYLKKKAEESNKNSPLAFKEKQHPASTLFRNGIKMRNLRKLQEHQKINKLPGHHIFRHV